MEHIRDGIGICVRCCHCEEPECCPQEQECPGVKECE